MKDKKTYGWKPDLPDKRDHVYSKLVSPANLPPLIDLRSLCPPVYDQGQFGSCTANALCAAFQFDLMKQGLPVFLPSRRFVYYNERFIEHTISSDSGAVIRDGAKTLNKQGVCPEEDCPYSTGWTMMKKRPLTKAFTNALLNKSIQYSRVSHSLNDMKSVLAGGNPFIFGFTVYDSFESQKVAKTGIVPMPSESESVLGGHAVLCVGYDDSTSRFIVRNSWGSGWGMRGYFTIPYEYLTDSNLSDDFWVIKKVS